MRDPYSHLAVPSPVLGSKLMIMSGNGEKEDQLSLSERSEIIRIHKCMRKERLCGELCVGKVRSVLKPLHPFLFSSLLPISYCSILYSFPCSPSANSSSECDEYFKSVYLSMCMCMDSTSTWIRMFRVVHKIERQEGEERVCVHHLFLFQCMH